MNEQLTVKNFGPIKDATVDFKRVTVFIGPTGGGKSTLAKLAAVFRSHNFLSEYPENRLTYLKKYLINNFLSEDSFFTWILNDDKIESDGKINFPPSIKANTDASEIVAKSFKSYEDIPNHYAILKELLQLTVQLKSKNTNDNLHKLNQVINKHTAEDYDSFQKAMSTLSNILNEAKKYEPIYIPTERLFIPAIEYSWAGMIRDDIGLSKIILEFANSFNTNKKDIGELDIPFIDAKYIHYNGNDYIAVS